jgi:probable F420-dependent oxidoreductase
MPQKAFRFGVTSYGAESGEEWTRKARLAEKLGYSSLFVSDHFMGQIATMPALAYAAASTSALRVGSIVCSNDFRHPILLAKEAATIDMLSGGRFELGIGAGYLKAEYDALGIPFEDGKIRVDRFEESIQIIKAYFYGEPIDFTGKHYAIQSEIGLDRIPAPVQKPHPPLIIGGGGKRMLRLAGREADIVSLMLQLNRDGTAPNPESMLLPFEQKIDWIRQGAGARFETLELNVQTWVAAVTDLRKQVMDQIGRQFPVPLETLSLLPFVLVGTVDEIIDQLQAHRSRYGISYFLVFDQYMEQFAPVVSALTGK